MNVTITVSGSRMDAAPVGKIDAVTAPQFQAELVGKLGGIRELVLDFGAVAYISSAGLRALLFLHQTMHDAGGRLVVRNVPPIVMTIFEVTDFDSVITIE